MTSGVLVVNAGSTSIKLTYFGPDRDDPDWATTLSRSKDDAAAIQTAVQSAPIDLTHVEAVGHRIVHGGERFGEPVIVDDGVEAAIRQLSEIAPLHNDAGLAGIAAARHMFGDDITQVALFDTAFHQTMPLAAAAYGGPFEWIERGLRRYGFHGISHEYAAHQAATMLGRPLEELRLVTCHLGGGCSITAVGRGQSVDTTMGFTPLDGLVMATRSGAVDPGLLIHLLRTGTTVEQLDNVLEYESGLLGLSGISSDLREVIAARDDGDPRARLAIDVFVHRVASGVGAMIAALGGMDAIVFTGGIGEGSPEVRTRVAERFAWTGAPALVVAACEELVIARATRALTSSRGAG